MKTGPYSLMAVLLDQAIGEIPAIRYIGYMDLLKEPKDGGDAILLDELKGCIDGKTGRHAGKFVWLVYLLFNGTGWTGRLVFA